MRVYSLKKKTKLDYVSSAIYWYELCSFIYTNFTCIERQGYEAMAGIFATLMQWSKGP
jgi:hypothetical protein